MDETNVMDIFSVELIDTTKQEDVILAPEYFEERILAVYEDLEKINLGTEIEIRKTFVAKYIALEEKAHLINFLKKYKFDVFTWNYEEMPGLPEDIVVHRLPNLLYIKLVKQAMRKFKPDVEKKITVEVKKLIDARLVRKE